MSSPAPHPSPPLIKKSLRRSHRNALKPARSMGNLYHNQKNSARHEEMIERFQIRRVSSYEGYQSKIGDSKKPIDMPTTTSQPNPQISPLRTLVRIAHQKQTLKASLSPMTPKGWASTMHGILLLTIYHFQIIYLPFAPSYYPNGSLGTTIIAMLLEMFFLLDLLLNFNTAYFEQELLVTSRSKIALNYIQKWFVFDLLSAVPIQAIYCFVANTLIPPQPTVQGVQLTLMVLRVLRVTLFQKRALLNRVMRVGTHVTQRLRYSRYSHLLGIAQLMWIVLLIAHYMACLWHAVCKQRVMTPEEDNTSVGERYVADYYYAVSLIQGQGNAIGSWDENLYSSVAIIVGSVILAIVFGNVAMLVSNFNANTTNYHRKMEAVHATMDKMGLPSKLRERVNEYYTHVWLEYEALDGNINTFQQELTHTLQLEIGLYKHRDLVVKIPFWEDCTHDFITQIVLNLGVRVYMPDDYVFRRHEIGSEMMMINMGYCKLLTTEKYAKKGKTVDDASDDRKNVLDDLQQPVLSSHHELSSHNSADLDDASDSESDHVNSGNDFSENEASRVPISIRRMSGSAFELRRADGTDTTTDSKPGNGFPRWHSNRPSTTEPNTFCVYLNPGQAFGEMSLLMNYKRKATVRAVTFVEMCVLDRKTFQSIITRYPNDRRRVLTKMLENCIEKKVIPFPWENIIEAVSNKRRNSGNKDISRASVIATMTAAEAAHILVEAIDVNTPDESIKYGFQSVDEEFVDEPRLRRANSVGAKIRDTLQRKNSGITNGLMGTLQRTNENAAHYRSFHRCNSVNSGRSSTTGDFTESESDVSVSSCYGGRTMENTLENMMKLMHTMVTSIGRLQEDVNDLKTRKCCCRNCDCEPTAESKPIASKSVRETSTHVGILQLNFDGASTSQGDNVKHRLEHHELVENREDNEGARGALASSVRISHSSGGEVDTVPGSSINDEVQCTHTNNAVCVLTPAKRGHRGAKVSPGLEASVVPTCIEIGNSSRATRNASNSSQVFPSPRAEGYLNTVEYTVDREDPTTSTISPSDGGLLRECDTETASGPIYDRHGEHILQTGPKAVQIPLQRVKLGLLHDQRPLPRRRSLHNGSADICCNAGTSNNYEKRQHMMPANFVLKRAITIGNLPIRSKKERSAQNHNRPTSVGTLSRGMDRMDDDISLDLTIHPTANDFPPSESTVLPTASRI